MGKDTVSNHKRIIATKGTSHVARTRGPTDILLNPAPPATAPFENHVPTTRLKKGQTTTTKIAGQPIWTAAGEVGPPSDDNHAPFVLGNTTKVPHQREAVPTSYSGDVLVEGNGVVRTNDTTKQNWFNTDGFVDGSALGQGEGVDEAFLKLKCSLTKLEGVAQAGSLVIAEKIEGSGSGPRKLGWPGEKEEGEAFYIEVLSGDEIKLTSTRIDATKPGSAENPTCELVPEHTTWLIKRTGGNVSSAEKTASGVEYTVPGTFTMTAYDKMPVLPSGEIKHEDKSAKTIMKTGRFNSQGSQSNFGIQGGPDALARFIELWGYKKCPGSIDVDAKACTGAKKAVIKVYPRKPAKISISYSKSSATGGDGWKTAMDKLLAIHNIVQRCVGSGVDINVEVMVGAKAEGEGQFKYCKEKKKTPHGVWKTPAHVGMPWKLTLAADPLFKFGVDVSVPIAVLAGGLGAAVARILTKCGIKADIVIGAGINSAISASLEWNEYEEPSGKGNVKFELSFSLKLVFKGPSSDGSWLTLGATVTGAINLDFTPSDKSDSMVKGEWQGTIQVSFEGKAFEGRWYEKELINVKPTWAKIEFQKHPFYLFKMS